MGEFFGEEEKVEKKESKLKSKKEIVEQRNKLITKYKALRDEFNETIAKKIIDMWGSRENPEASQEHRIYKQTGDVILRKLAISNYIEIFMESSKDLQNNYDKLKIFLYDLIENEIVPLLDNCIEVMGKPDVVEAEKKEPGVPEERRKELEKLYFDCKDRMEILTLMNPRRSHLTGPETLFLKYFDQEKHRFTKSEELKKNE